MMIEAKLDYQDAQKAIENLGLNTPRIMRKIIRTALNQAKRNVRKSYKSVLTIRSGDLYNSLFVYNKNTTFGMMGVLSRKLYKAKTLEYGKKILPKNGKYLTFKTESGTWIKATEVNVRPHPFFEQTINNFLRSDLDRITNELLDKEYNKVWNK